MIPKRKLLLLVSENFILTAGLFAGTSFEPLASNPMDWTLGDPAALRGLLTCFTIAVIGQASLSYNDLYDWRVAQNRAELPNRLLHSCGYCLVMMAFLVFVLPSLFVFPGLADVRGETWKLIVLLVGLFLVIYVFRLWFHWFFYKWRFGEQVVVLGDGETAENLCQLMLDMPMSGFELLGRVCSGEVALTAAPKERVLGNVEALPRICSQYSVARVVVALKERRGAVPISELLECRMSGVLVEERETMFERLTGKIAVESMRPSYLIFGRGFVKVPAVLVGKRVIDIVASLLGLVLSLPISLLAALFIKLTSKGPVFFTQERVGQDGQTFHIIKFRTMTVDAEKESGPVWAQKGDTRVTPVGRFLRLTRIDEIPQFVNILAGKMSFVGPRPERPFFVEELAESIPFYPLRHTVKPGLTGWAQVSHRYGSSVDDAMEKLRYDLYYIKNMNPFFDLNIILRTVGVILFGKGAR